MGDKTQVIPLADRYYGLRDFTIADPDGFGIRFASALFSLSSFGEYAARSRGDLSHARASEPARYGLHRCRIGVTGRERGDDCLHVSDHEHLERRRPPA